MMKLRMCALLFALMLLSGIPNAISAEKEILVPMLQFQRKTLPDLASYRFVEELRAGWNLGNTFDAHDAGHVRDEMDYETAWSGVKTSPGVFAALKTAGFGVVRIPVSWHNHVSGEDFIISAAWLARVRQVVDEALAAGLHVILNTHHDNMEGFIYPDDAHLESSGRYLRAIWRQLGTAFRDYDERLIMESMNEPRLSGTPLEWHLDPRDSRSLEAVKAINALNQLFVDTVRACGGNNGQRYLMVPGYAASVQGCLHEAFAMPVDMDSAKDRLLLSLHAYTPYDFALQSPAESGSRDTFSADNALDINAIAVFMDQVYSKFSSLKVPVVIGEFGCRDKNGNLQSRVDFTATYIALARARGITCVWWDNNVYRGDGERFGLIDRRSFRFPYPQILQAIMDNAQ
ncbi:MAG: glycoside hydrolase family 5 protein [Christensenellales bacterium]